MAFSGPGRVADLFFGPAMGPRQERPPGMVVGQGNMALVPISEPLVEVPVL